MRCWREGDAVLESVDLTSDAAAGQFWAGQPTLVSFCSGSPSFRWSWSLSGADATAAIDRYLPILGGVSPKPTDGIGRLRELSIMGRTSSGKAALVRVVGERGRWDVKGEMSIRSVLRAGPGAPALRSANVVLSLQRDADGVTRLDGRGGGYGHGVGMCQFGAKGMAEQGLDYRTILRHYYQDVAVEAV